MKKLILAALFTITSFAANAGVGGWVYHGTDIYGTIYHYKDVRNMGDGHVMFQIAAKYKNGAIITLVQETDCNLGFSRQWINGERTTWASIAPGTVQEELSIKTCKKVS